MAFSLQAAGLLLTLSTFALAAPFGNISTNIAAAPAISTVTETTVVTQYTTLTPDPTGSLADATSASIASSTSLSAAATTTSTSVAAASPSASLSYTPGKLNLNFVNNLPAGPAYAYFTATDSNGKLVMLTESGTFYHPSTTESTPVAIPDSANVALKLNSGSNSFTIPEYVSGARLWFSQGTPLQFNVTNTGGLVEPSSANDDDPNHDTNWGFVELTFNAEVGLFANLSFVDMLGLPLGIKMNAVGNITQTAFGPHGAAVQSVCTQLKKQAESDGQPWDNLCKNDSSGKLIRVVSPQTLLSQNTSSFANYFESYVEQVYERFASEPLHIQTQEGPGLVNCTVASGSLACEGDDTPFGKPSTEDILGCNSGPFANAGNDVHLAVLPRLCAAFNRATLHIEGGNVQPSVPPSHYYSPPANNWYSAFVHGAELDGKGYAFSYDDVTPSEKFDSAGVVSNPKPQLLTVYVGGATSADMA
ncbi:glycoside hydrolase family 64 protein [Xylariaceae sp. FL0804]|nr:glycoside hydrolase family 64 protein [Xylariaceae sp. FL0804]